MINAALGIWQFLLVWAIGSRIGRSVNARLPLGYRAALAFGLGEAAVSYSLFALGLVGGLRFWVLVPAAALGTALCAPAFFREARTWAAAAWPRIVGDPAASAMAAFLFSIYILGACVPEREVDSLWYHLATPLHYIHNGGFIREVPFNMPSHYPMNVHLHYAFSLLVGNDTTAKFFILCHFVPMLILLWSATRRYAGARWGLFAVAAYLCILHFRLPVMVNVQRAVYFHVFLSTVLLWNALERKDRQSLILAALFCGMAMGSKFNGLLFGYVSQWLLMSGWVLLGRGIPAARRVGWWCAHSAIAWAMMGPWLVKSWLLTGNPLYPMLGSVFPTDPHFAPAMHSNDRNHGLNLLKSDTAGEFVGQVWVNIQWLLYNNDLIFFLGLLAVVTLPFLPAPRKFYPLASGWLAYALFTLLWGSDIARLFGANYGATVLLTAMTVQQIQAHLEGRVRFAPAFRWVILISLLVTFLMGRHLYLSSPNIRWFGGVYLSEAARREWLAERRIFTPALFRMKDWMDEHIPPDEMLYGYRTGYLFYLDRKYIVSGAHFGEQMDKWLDVGLDEAARNLRALDAEWLLFAEPDGAGGARLPHPRFEAFIERYGRLRHREGNIVLHRLIDGAANEAGGPETGDADSTTGTDRSG